MPTRLLIALSLLFAQPCPALGKTPPNTSPDLAPQELVLLDDPGPFEHQITREQIADGVTLFICKLTADEPATLKPFKLRFKFPSADIHGHWSSVQQMDRSSYYRSRFKAESAGPAPVICFYNNRQQNRVTVATSETRNPVAIGAWLPEETLLFQPTLSLATVRMPATKEYTVQVRVDTRQIPYHEALDDVRLWWESVPGYQRAPVPDAARRPVYSTWYNYHQQLEPDTLVAECKRAKELGCEVIIIDDGWQTLDSNRGYRYVGDWKPLRIPNMRRFVDRIHATGMKAMLWYAVPFMGEEAERYDEFAGKYLWHWKGQGCKVLDPRYPEVREMMIQTYERALKEWNLDGFKLDFVGTFKVRGDTVLTAEEGRDFASVNNATDRLMLDILSRLRAIKPDVLIEFRQPYVGPEMQKYGNMFRGTDCPNNAAVNRAEIANCRLLCGPSAVHSDMFAWRPEEPAHAAALQVLNVLFSVPQVSVRLDEQSEEHTTMLRHWLGYWNTNREVLLDGDFYPGNPGANFPSLTAVKEGKQITALYETTVATQQAPGLKTFDVVNACGADTVLIDLTEDWGVAKLRVFDAIGNVVEQAPTISLGKGVHRFTVPLSGLVRIER